MAEPRTLGPGETVDPGPLPVLVEIPPGDGYAGRPWPSRIDLSFGMFSRIRGS